MSNGSVLLAHAHSAVARATRAVDDLRARFEATSEQMTRAHRLQAEKALQDLHRQRETLTQLYRDMVDAPTEGQPALWGKFFACYDECLESTRELSCGLGTRSIR